MGIHNGEEYLYTSVEVSLHEVGASQIDLGVTAMVKVVDTVVFEEWANNAPYLDLFTEAG